MRRVEQVMGTAVSLHLADPLPGSELRRLGDEVFAWLHEVDRRFSTYREDSEVNRVQRGELDPVDGSADLRKVLDTCAELWRATDGYFDAYATGRLDPSGYVKGWSVQVASDRLAAAGAGNHFLNAGGDVVIRGRPQPRSLSQRLPASARQSGEQWRVGIRHPWDALAVCWVLRGTDLAVATSGTYERGHHVVDPHRGAPATALRSVTVVGDDLGLADAYATAALAMGRAGLDWLARLDGYESGVVTEDGQAYRSAGFPVAP
jgi:FAD:protein FMN transferase